MPVSGAGAHFKCTLYIVYSIHKLQTMPVWNMLRTKMLTVVDAFQHEGTIALKSQFQLRNPTFVRKNNLI